MSTIALLRATAIASLVVPLILFALVAWQSFGRNWRDAEARLSYTLDLVHEHAVKVMETQELVAGQVQEMLRGLDDDAVRADATRIEDRLVGLTRALPQIQGIWVLDARGRPLVTSSPGPVSHDLDLSDRKYYQVHRDDPDRGPYVSGALHGRAMDVTFFQVAVRRGGAEFRGVTAVSMDPEYFQDFYRRAALEPPFSAALLRADGAMLARYPPPPRPLHETAPLALFARQVAAVPDAGAYVAVTGLDGRERLILYRRLPGYPVYAVTATTTRHIREEWLGDLANDLAFALPPTLLLFLVTLVALRRARGEAAALAAAEQASRAKSDFLATLGHEIRTPMNAILGLGRLVQDDPGLSAEGRRHAAAVQMAGENLLALLNDLLDLSKAEAGYLRLERVPFDLGRIARECVAMFAATARGKGIAIAAVVPDRPLWFLGDPLRIRQILLNLVGNAVKFTPSGRVELDLTVEEAAPGTPWSIRMTVSDSGQGIPADQLDRLFRPFEQGDPSITRRYGGTGLGLAIARRLARMMGGDVTAESRPGVGSRFTVDLALDPAAAEGSDAPPPAGPLSAGSLSILVAEDEPLSGEFMRAMLSALGHRITVVPDGAAAADACRTGDYDLVLMDVWMPGVDGVEATRRIRRAETAGRRVAIVGLTADTTAQQRDECLAAGMDAVVAKPVDLAALERAVSSAMGASSAA
ncbi:ATP-binding protein [Stella sp.]|uniref:hybrid sensor histidine kinase/response regulator n=1 Tax=Stella sp. TaxID=2912054 RepID=UPI0035AE0F9D